MAIAAACVVQIAEIELEPAADGWTETLHLEIAVPASEDVRLGPACPTLTLSMPAGARWLRTKGRTLLAGGSRHRLRDVRFEMTGSRVDRSRDTIVHLPELASPGDRAVLDLVRELPVGEVRWVDASARYLRIASQAELAAPSDLTHDRERGSVWGRDVAGVTVVAETDLQPTPTPDQPLTDAPAETTIEGRLTLVVPRARDALVTLYPGGGSSLETQLFVTLPPSDAAVGWIVPAPPGTAVEATVTPPSRARVTTAYGVTRIEAPPSEGRTQVAVRWTTPDAPTFGVVPRELGPGSPGRVVDWTVAGGRGTVRWDEAQRRWALVGIDGQPIIPDRERFVRALGARFDGLSMPEPSLPQVLRGIAPSRGLAAELPAALRRRVGVTAPGAGWPHDPLWPRKLRSASRSGAVTPTEGALLLWLMARQTGLSATWGFVRPATGPEASATAIPGPSPTRPVDDSPREFETFASPGGYARPIVVLFFDQEGTFFIDPSCDVCGPFELPRELWGSPVLSPELARTPPPPQGDIDVGFDDDGRTTYRFTGAAALWLRRQARDEQAVLDRLGGDGATGEVSGLANLGRPVTVTLDPLVAYDPLQLGAGSDAPFVVVPGTRTVRSHAHAMQDIDVTIGSLRYRRETKEDETLEVLEITGGWVDPTEASALQRLRFAGNPTPTSDEGSNPTPK